VDQINKRLDDRFRLLTGGSRTALERHQTLRATIDWSYNLLFREEKLLLCRLSVFLGGWDLEAAEQVCAGSNDISSSEVLDLLTHLVDKSLVILEEPRYRMLETTRQYARENLLDLEEGKMLRERHLAYFLELAENAEQEIHGPGRIDGTNRLKLDNDNIRAALDWCVSEGNTEVALRLLGVWTRAGLHHFSEIKNWFQKIRALPDIMEHPALYARLLSYMGRSSDIVGDYRHARLLMEESRALWVKLGPEGELGLAEALAFFAVISLGGETAARPLLEQSFELYQKHGNHWGMARVMFGLGLEAMWVCNYVEAEEQFKKSLAKFQELGDYAEIRRVFNMMGELARLQDDYERAGACYEQAIKTAKELGHGAQIVLLNLGWVFLHENDYHRAKVLFKESFELLNNDGNQYALILWLGGFASIFAMTGKLEHAARLFGASAQLLKNTRSLEPSDQKEFDHYVALVRAQLDDTAFAKAWAAGCEMTLEQAIAFALKETNE
jgi:non-specific serine/threonine protein kinase